LEENEMKKLVMVLLALTLILGLFGCAAQNTTPKAEDSKPASEQPASSQPASVEPSAQPSEAASAQNPGGKFKIGLNIFGK